MQSAPSKVLSGHVDRQQDSDLNDLRVCSAPNHGFELQAAGEIAASETPVIHSTCSVEHTPRPQSGGLAEAACLRDHHHRSEQSPLTPQGRRVPTPGTSHASSAHSINGNVAVGGASSNRATSPRKYVEASRDRLVSPRRTPGADANRSALRLQEKGAHERTRSPAASRSFAANTPPNKFAPPRANVNGIKASSPAKPKAAVPVTARSSSTHRAEGGALAAKGTSGRRTGPTAASPSRVRSPKRAPSPNATTPVKARSPASVSSPPAQFTPQQRTSGSGPGRPAREAGLHLVAHLREVARRCASSKPQDTTRHLGSTF